MQNYRALMNDLEYDESLIMFIKELKRTLQDDWDEVVAITGGKEGIGKSTLAMIIGFLTDDNFDIRKNISYLPTTKEVEEKFNNLNQYEILVIDEAIKVLYKLNWMDKLQIRINQLYATERKQNKATILCIPRLRDLNEQFRNHKVHVNIHIVARGYAIAFVRDDYNFATVDPFHLKETDKMLEKLRVNRRIMEIDLGERLAIYRKVPNYFFDFVFPQLPEEIFNAYKQIGTEYRSQKLDKEQETAKSLVLLGYRAGLTQDELASCARVTQSTISRWIRESEGITAL